MHSEAYHWLTGAADLVGSYLLRSPRKPIACELGAYDVNGSARPLFPSTWTWVGVDLRPGKGVSIVADATEPDADLGDGYDLVLCTEVLEHCRQPAAMIANAYRILFPGGWFIMTCAGPGRAPHGVDGGPVLPDEHYAGVSELEVRSWCSTWPWVATFDRDGQDTYLLALR